MDSRPPRLLLLACLIASAAAACAHPKKSRTVVWTPETTPEDTRIYHFMADSSRHYEPRSDHLMDEAMIASLSPDQACFDLVVRSRHSIDLHPSQWEVKVNGKLAHVEQRGEADRAFWTTTVRRQETVLTRTSPRGETTITRPVEYEEVGGYAVRRAHLCAPLTGIPGKLELEVRLPDPVFYDHWGQKYEWKLVGGPPPGAAGGAAAARAPSAPAQQAR
jgi:hypothetical protein